MAKQEYRHLDELLATESPEFQKEVKQKSEKLALEIGLSMLREELDLSQKDIAHALGISQPAIAKIEQRGNEMKLSTLKRYVETMGGKVRLIIDMPSGESRSYNI